MKYESYEEYDQVRFGTTGGSKELKRLRLGTAATLMLNNGACTLQPGNVNVVLDQIHVRFMVM